MIKNSLAFILLLSLFLWNCEEIPNSTIELKTVDYSVTSINAPTLVVYSEDNQSFTTSVTITNAETVNSVWFDVLTLNGSEEISTFNLMSSSDNGEVRTYQGEGKIDENLLSGKYEIVYYVEDNVRTSDENVKKIGVKQFDYLSEAINFPPSISNLEIPSEIDKGIQFSFKLFASDPNGQSDIDLVYYQLKDPTGKLLTNSQGISKFPMFDDGNRENNSDVTANDGIFSVYLSFPTSVRSGSWKFQFNAVDKSDSISNTIDYTLKVN